MHGRHGNDREQTGNKMARRYHFQTYARQVALAFQFPPVKLKASAQGQ